MNQHGNLSSVTAILERVGRAGDGKTVGVNDIVTAIGDDVFPPLLLVPALLLVSPLSGVPGMSIFGGLIMVTISLQMILSRPHLWLPGFITRRSVSKKKLDTALAWLSRPAGILDRITKQRLSILVRGPMTLVTELLCLVSAAIVPFLEIVPFSSSVVSAGIAFFALALFTRDGLLVLIGLAVLAGAGSLIAYFL